MGEALGVLNKIQLHRHARVTKHAAEGMPALSSSFRYGNKCPVCRTHIRFPSLL